VDLIPANANARHAALRRINRRLFAGLLVAMGLLLADGGLAQFQGQAGGFVITVFSAPVPLRVGLADLSVMVQKADDRSDVLDCDVTLHLSKPGEEEISVAAIPGQARNKLLYAAHPVIRKPGEWNLNVEIKRRRETVRVNGELTVLPELPLSIAYWPYFAALPIAVTLFALNQWLKAQRKVKNLRARP
jgi:hypothetical protein